MYIQTWNNKSRRYEKDLDNISGLDEFMGTILIPILQKKFGNDPDAFYWNAKKNCISWGVTGEDPNWNAPAFCINFIEGFIAGYEKAWC